MAEGEDRSEAATPRRLQKAREEGNVPLSREVAPAAALAAAALVLMLALPQAATRLAASLAVLLEQAHAITPGAGLRLALGAALPVALPFAAAAMLAAAASLGQTGFLLRVAALQPSLGRLDLRRNLARIGGRRALLELGRSVVKVALLGAAMWQALAASLPWLDHAALWQPGTVLDRSLRLGLRVLLAALAAQALLAGADVAYARWSHARSLRMSRQELREELRESDGDPKIKARIRRIRLNRARRRMLASVPKATVVVTNPTHYAVALAYERGGGGAPRVTAKGIDAMAARIRETAERARVPLVANPPLARALYQVELDGEIPAVLFQAVAEIIAYVWRISGKSAGAGARQ